MINEKNVTQNAYLIYDYVVNKLEYNFDVKNQETIKRHGAINALSNPNIAACMEFTDLFITIARASGIPAREINGYAFADENQNKPLSIQINSLDRLHAWPEFYDPNLGWVQIDPTWASTAGLDFFTKLDTNHFTFVTKGVDSMYPTSPGEYRYQDGSSTDKKLLDVSFLEDVDDELFTDRLIYFKTSVLNPLNWIGKRRVIVANSGNTFIRDIEGQNITLPPGQKTTISIPNKEYEQKTYDYQLDKSKLREFKRLNTSTQLKTYLLTSAFLMLGLYVTFYFAKYLLAFLKTKVHRPTPLPRDQDQLPNQR